MKYILTAILLFSASALAGVFPDMTGVTEVPSGKPGVFKFHIDMGTEGGQAATYTDVNLPELYLRLKTEYPLLTTMINDIYHENGCDLDGTGEGEDWYCGDLDPLVDDNTVNWSFGRGGWASAGRSMRSYLAWISAGSGHFTDVVMEVKTEISVNAISGGINENEPVIFEVTIDMSEITRVSP